MVVKEKRLLVEKGVVSLQELNLESINSRTPLFCEVVTEESHKQHDCILALVLVGCSGRDQITVIASTLI